jgi:small ligand-binding sensory domain FIST
MRWASGISTNGNMDICIDETAEAIRSQLGGADAHLTVIFVSPHFKARYNRIPEMIRQRLSPGMLIGCSGRGIIGDGREVEDRAAFSMTCAHLPGVKIQPFFSDAMLLPEQETSPAVWRQWIGVEPEPNLNFIMLADPFSFRGEEFLEGLDFAYPRSVKLGGLASGSNVGGGNALYLDRKIHMNGMVGVALSGNIEVDTIVAQGCRPIGKPLKITKCSQTLLLEVDGKPPVKILEELFAAAGEYDRQLIQTSLFLGIEMNPLEENSRPGNFLIRNLMGLDRETGAIAIGALMREGQLVQFHLRDKIMSAEDLDILLTRYTSRNVARQASGALLFSCLGRGRYLYGKPNHDSEMFRDKLGNVPLGGFFCNGEIGPVGDTTYLHGYTSSFGIFRSLDTATHLREG